MSKKAFKTKINNRRITTCSNSPFYIQGRQDRQNGMTIEQCRYTAGTEMARLWQQGWKEKEEEYLLEV